MDIEALKRRTKAFAVMMIKLADQLPNTIAGRAAGNQIVRSASSVGANYRSACRSRSRADFISKISIVHEEADETLYWIEIIEETCLLPGEVLKTARQEASELTAIFTASANTAKGRK